MAASLSPRGRFLAKHGVDGNDISMVCSSSSSNNNNSNSNNSIFIAHIHRLIPFIPGRSRASVQVDYRRMPRHPYAACAARLLPKKLCAAAAAAGGNAPAHLQLCRPAVHGLSVGGGRVLSVLWAFQVAAVRVVVEGSSVRGSAIVQPRRAL